MQQLACKIAQNDQLIKENEQLRQLATKSKTNARPHGKHLIIADNAFNGLASANDNLDIVQAPDMTYENAAQVLTDKAKLPFNKITIVVGSNDCKKDTPIDKLTSQLSKIALQAKSITSDIQISSILPNLINKTAQEKATHVNSFADSLCTQHNISYVSNNSSFLLGDGGVNEGFLQSDGEHLNEAGSNRLARNLNIRDQVTLQTNPWKVNQKAGPSKANQTRPAQVKGSVRNVGKQQAPCFNCGEWNHTSNICVYKKRITCHRCHLQGHKANSCGKV